MNGAKVPQKSHLVDPDYTLKLAEDPDFKPPQRYTYFNGKAYDIDKDAPAGARRRKERTFSIASAGPHYGRPRTRPTAEELQERFVDTTYWLDGEWFTDDITSPLPLSKRHPLDPEHLVSCLSLLEYWLNETTGPQIRVIVREREDHLRQLKADGKNERKNLKWTNRKVTMDELHRKVHEKGPISAYELADVFHGPFDSIHERRHAERKVSELLSKARVKKLLDCTVNQRPTLYSSIRDPDVVPPCAPATLGIARPELKRGRYCVTCEGEALIKFFAEEIQLDFEEHVGRVAAAMDLRVGSRENDDDHGDEPMPRKRVHRNHHHVKCNLIRAYDVLRGVRLGQYGEYPWRPTLCYFKFWARMLYAPIPSGSGDYMLDVVASTIPEPTVQEARYMELKAFNKLRELEKRRLVVRRRAPDGSTLLFESGDPEAAGYPLVDNAVRAP